MANAAQQACGTSCATGSGNCSCCAQSRGSSRDGCSCRGNGGGTLQQVRAWNSHLQATDMYANACLRVNVSQSRRPCSEACSE